MRTHSPSWFILSSEATADIQIDALVPAIVFTILASIMVGLRWYSRLYSACGVKTEDYLVTAALILSIGNTAVIGAEYRVDSRRKDLDLSQQSSMTTMLKVCFKKKEHLLVTQRHY